MKDTAEESADLKMALKHDPLTPALSAEAEAFPLEADEAASEVERGLDTCAPDSWVAWVAACKKQTGVPKDARCGSTPK